MKKEDLEKIVKSFFDSFDPEAVTSVVEKTEGDKNSSDATVGTPTSENRRDWWVKVSSPNSGHLIGKMGETLMAIQEIIRLMVAQSAGEFIPVTVDVDEYKEKKEAELIQLATMMAENVKISGYGQEMKPMGAYERRLVHMALEKFDGIKSDAIGEGELRRIRIEPIAK